MSFLRPTVDTLKNIGAPLGWRWLPIVLVIVALVVWSFAPFQYQRNASVWVGGATLVFSVINFALQIWFLRDNKLGSRIRNYAPLGVSALLVICSGMKEIAGEKTREFEPIDKASGAIYVEFNDQLPAETFRFLTIRFPPWIAVSKAPVVDHAAAGYFTWQESGITIDEVDGRTLIRIPIAAEAQLWPNRLDEMSAKTFAKDFDYLIAQTIMTLPKGTSFVGRVELLLNGKRYYEFKIPRHYFDADCRIFIPLNERARMLMDEYKKFNPTGGTKLTYSSLDAPPKK